MSDDDFYNEMGDAFGDFKGINPQKDLPPPPTEERANGVNELEKLRDKYPFANANDNKIHEEITKIKEENNAQKEFNTKLRNLNKLIDSLNTVLDLISSLTVINTTSMKRINNLLDTLGTTLEDIIDMATKNNKLMFPQQLNTYKTFHTALNDFKTKINTSITNDELQNLIQAMRGAIELIQPKPVDSNCGCKKKSGGKRTRKKRSTRKTQRKSKHKGRSKKSKHKRQTRR